VGQSNSFFRVILKKKTGFYRLNRLQPVTVAFLIIINKFSETGRHKINLVAFLENLKSLVAFRAKHSLTFRLMKATGEIAKNRKVKRVRLGGLID